MTLIVITGPTGVGKTELCLRVANTFHIPIINADSRQMFAEITIGTAAPTPSQKAAVRHYFVGNLHLGDYYSASNYERDVLTLLDELFKESNVALMSGGSMMYIDAVCKGIDDIPTIRDDIRQTMKQRLASEGLPALVDELRRLDPEHWAIVDKNNPRRVVHALEICHQTGRTYTSFRLNKVKQRPFDIVKIGLSRPREILYARINARVIRMIDNGLIDEAMRVLPYRGVNALNTVGFKEMFEYLDGLTTLDEATAKIQSNTRRYARKQLTWFKRDETVSWFSPDNIEEILKYIDAKI